MVDGIFVFLRQYLIFGRGSGTIYQKINLSTGWASYFCVTPLLETFLSGSLNWARFPLLSYSSPLLSPFLSGPLNWALFWAKLLNWALFWANPLVWALFWALKRVNLLSRALFWVVLLFWALFWALKKALKLSQNLYVSIIPIHGMFPKTVIDTFHDPNWGSRESFQEERDYL